MLILHVISTESNGEGKRWLILGIGQSGTGKSGIGKSGIGKSGIGKSGISFLGRENIDNLSSNTTRLK